MHDLKNRTSFPFISALTEIITLLLTGNGICIKVSNVRYLTWKVTSSKMLTDHVAILA